MNNNTKPLHEIVTTLRTAGTDSIERWQRNGHCYLDISPPDLIALTDQFKMIKDLAPEMSLPMQLLQNIANTMCNSNNTEMEVIGQVISQCHAELKALTDFCSDLATKDVAYPVQDPKEDEE